MSHQRLAGWLLLALVCGKILQVFYSWIGTWSSPSWWAIAGVHTLMAVLLLWRCPPQLPTWQRLRSSWVCLPPLAVGLGALLLSLSSRTESTAAASIPEPWVSVGLIVWVPLVEELVYRRSLGKLLRRRAGLVFGSYLTSLIFAMAHGAAAGWLPLPALGPFLLGLACELVYRRSGTLLAPIALHASCNATVLIFLSLDSRWLEWLRLLYIKV